MTYLKELLNDIISKNINHELVGSLQNLTKDQLTLCRICSFQLQLNKPEHTHTVFHKYSHVITVQTIAGTSLAKPSCRLVLLQITVLLFNRSKIFVTTNHGGHLATQHKQDMKKCTPGAMLVLRELHHMACNLTQLEVRVTVVTEVLKQAAASRWHHIRHAVTKA